MRIFTVRLSLISILALLGTSCAQTTSEKPSDSSNKSKQPDFVQRAERAERQVFRRHDFHEAVSTYVRTNYPGSTVNGIGHQSDAGNLYLLAVDLSSPTKGEVIQVIGRVFVTRDGDPYWRIDPPTDDLLKIMKLIEQSTEKQKEQGDD